MTKVNPVCPDCGGTKTPAEFYADRKKSNGLSTYCRECCRVRAKASYARDPERSKAAHRAWVAKNPDRVRAHKAQSAYGISAAELQALANVCVICGEKTGLCIDHNHLSGRVRGMLCTPCNKGLGFFRDNPSLLYRAADYVLGVAKPDIFEATYEPVS